MILANTVDEIKTEIFRKSIHFLIAIVPSLAIISTTGTLVLLVLGVILYSYAETLRLSGVVVPFISQVTFMAARKRDQGRFVLGPVTLGIGAMLALLLYPAPASSIAIYALAFGDGLASLIGKVFGKIRPLILMGKSIEGSLACFFAVFLITYRISKSISLSFFTAIAATLIEIFPLKDFDNIIMPIGVGFIVWFLQP
ncbi:diacylglycerol/polyprenol kinase family protein [Gracilinema caldarium]|uniref:Phosphatidate cytidylyltransferase n=1 Tax=Gracilinema caldarium (strain ATCC 51460 / DSM 7334 / H1) TaxID=744872 RepID=F8EZG3_GRAC1|nr:phosphatidate cytidylyltransferase [Gracilinema caldarium]AEJ20186.1 phosphatidate cytidylyltransferase [Gracilinema caldarium DSM 7334]